jgi:hypothetical protein
MKALHANVCNGRLVLDEPTDLPEGSVIPIKIADDWDNLDDEERAALHAELDASLDEANAGKTIPAHEVLASLESPQ